MQPAYTQPGRGRLLKLKTDASIKAEERLIKQEVPMYSDLRQQAAHISTHLRGQQYNGAKDQTRDDPLPQGKHKSREKLRGNMGT